MDTLEQFEEKFGTEQQCFDYLFNLRWPHGYRCPRCHYDEFWQITDRKYKCKSCGYQATVTAGTLFQDSHIPFDKWLKAAWYLTSSHGRKTATELQKLIGLGSNRTALLIMEKYALVWDGCVDQHLKGIVEVQTRKIMLPSQKGKISVLLIAAAELHGSKTGRIQMGIIEEKYYHNENEFVRQTVIPGSELVGVRWNNNNILFESNEYTRAKKRPNYTFKYTTQVLDNLGYSIQKNQKQKCSLSRFIKAHCFKYNRFQGNVDFDTLVKAAITFQPILSQESG